jgi:modulator of FtsH protease HflK
MKKGVGIFIIIILYLATGFFTVGGNEIAVIQRFGKLVTTDNQKPYLYQSGLHLEFPWPCSKITKANLNEIRSLKIGVLYQTENSPEIQTVPNENQELTFLRNADSYYPSRFLTGDKNIIELKLTMQFRIHENQLTSYLFANENPEYQLKILAESIVTDLISRSGVDYVHPSGLAELQNMITRKARKESIKQDLGFYVDDVSIDSVMPPQQVKPWFLDVSNARADKEKQINSANNFLLQKEQKSKADSQKIINEAITFQNRTVENAKGIANRFNQFIDQFSASDHIDYNQARHLTSQRMYFSTMKRIFDSIKVQVLLDNEQPANLMLFPDSSPARSESN